MKKDVKQFIKELRKRGWVDEGYNGKGHQVMRHANGKISISTHPSCPYGLENAKKDARRVETGVNPSSASKQPQISSSYQRQQIPSQPS